MTVKDRVLQYSSSIFKYYFGSYKIGTYYKSPFRKEKRPSFNIFVNNVGLLFFKDFGNTKGNAIDFVMELYRMTFTEAINRIIIDLKIDTSLGIKYREAVVKRDKIQSSIKREKILQPIYFKYNNKPVYTEFDKIYWLDRLKIGSLNYLIKHHVYSAKELLINNARVWSAYYGDPIYIYREKYLSKVHSKAYKPLDRLGDKWRSDYPNAKRMIHNLENLDFSKDEVIITKSNKDCIILDSLGFNVCNTQGEDMEIPRDIIEVLKDNFNLFLLYDCDYNKEENKGYILSNKYANMYGINEIKISEHYEATDTAELISKLNRETVKMLINKWKI